MKSFQSEFKEDGRNAVKNVYTLKSLETIVIVLFYVYYVPDVTIPITYTVCTFLFLRYVERGLLNSGVANRGLSTK